MPLGFACAGLDLTSCLILGHIGDHISVREFNSATGLHYYRARYYDPSSGRFTKEDPIGFTGGLNLYRYSYNSADNLIDPFGLSPKSGGITKCFGVAFFTAVKKGPGTPGAGFCTWGFCPMY